MIDEPTPNPIDTDVNAEPDLADNSVNEHQTEDLDPSSVGPQAQSGIIAGLAATLVVGGAIVLAIAKTSEDEILISIQPHANKGDTSTALPIQVSGTAKEIDAHLLDALAHYVPARQFVNRTAEQIAADTTKAAAAAKKAADTKRTSTASTSKPKADVEKLFVNATPQFAKLDVVDGHNKKHVVANNRRVDLPVGTYTITAKADGYVSASATIKIQKGKPEKIDLILERDEPSLLDTIAGA